MKKASKTKAKTPTGSKPATQPEETPGKLGAAGFIGIGLIAAAAFNIPYILKVPQTGADWLLLTIVLAMAAVGIILLIGRHDQ